LTSATVSRPSLDDVYLSHTGHSLTHAQQSVQPEDAQEAAS
jgi:hypothetical protein